MAIESSAVEAYERYGRPLVDYEPAPVQHWAANLSAGLLWVAQDAAARPVAVSATGQLSQLRSKLDKSNKP